MISIQNDKDWNEVNVEIFQCLSSRMPRDGRVVSPFSDSLVSGSNVAVTPGAHDVLWGRTKKAHGHQGNAQFRRLIRYYRSAYQGTRVRDEKSRVVRAIIEKVASVGGRFLKCVDDSGDCWYEVGSAQVYDKVSHALRSAKPSKRPSASTVLETIAAHSPPTEVVSNPLRHSETLNHIAQHQGENSQGEGTVDSYEHSYDLSKIDWFTRNSMTSETHELGMTFYDEEDMAIFLEDVDL